MNLELSGIKVLLIGDFMVDHYIMGKSERMSPEAPVPIVIPKEEYSIPGGAGNVAMNMCTLAGQRTLLDMINLSIKPFIFCIGTVGHDAMGTTLLNKLNLGVMERKNRMTIFHQDSIDTSNIMRGDIDNSLNPVVVSDNYRGSIQTTTKERIYLDGKQIHRLDRESILNQNYNEELNDLVTNNIAGKDIIVLSDYNKGVLNENTIPHILSEAKKNNIPVIIDPKKEDFAIYAGADIITPNLNELRRASELHIDDDKSIVEACKELIEKYDFNFIVAKKSERGITIVGKNHFVKHIQAHNVSNPDVTGAGDTVIATLALVYALTKDIEKSTIIANIAAAITVGKSGTATVTIDEINNYIKTNE